MRPPHRLVIVLARAGNAAISALAEPETANYQP